MLVNLHRTRVTTERYEVFRLSCVIVDTDVPPVLYRFMRSELPVLACLTFSP